MNNAPKRLALNVETLKRLQGGDLTTVLGAGAFSGLPGGCPSNPCFTGGCTQTNDMPQTFPCVPPTTIPGTDA